MKIHKMQFPLAFAALLCGSAALFAQDYKFSVVARGLVRPTGIVTRGGETIYFTEIPTPGVGGGLNAVKAINVRSQRTSIVHQGEPEPTNIALDREGNLYWTCKSAGVILEQSPRAPQSTAVAVLKGLAKPSGVAVDRDGDIYFTQLPTPGVPGGKNTVSVFDGTETTVLHEGEPEPTDIAVGRDGDIYWTCKSAGVILTQDDDGKTSVLLKNLPKPTGIALDKSGRHLFWTEVPTPGLGGTSGGTNKVWTLDLKSGKTTLIHAGDPEPTDVTVARNGDVYWTCSSAGVIVQAKRNRDRDDDDDRDTDK